VKCLISTVAERSSRWRASVLILSPWASVTKRVSRTRLPAEITKTWAMCTPESARAFVNSYRKPGVSGALICSTVYRSDASLSISMSIGGSVGASGSGNRNAAATRLANSPWAVRGCPFCRWRISFSKSEAYSCHTNAPGVTATGSTVNTSTILRLPSVSVVCSYV